MADASLKWLPPSKKCISAPQNKHPQICSYNILEQLNDEVEECPQCFLSIRKRMHTKNKCVTPLGTVHMASNLQTFCKGGEHPSPMIIALLGLTPVENNAPSLPSGSCMTTKDMRYVVKII